MAFSLNVRVTVQQRGLGVQYRQDVHAARRAERDVKAVHGDVTALLNAGVLDKTEDGQIVFPYEAVKVEFLLQAA